ncbi:pseudouridine synthase [Thermodesulfobacteriota bacterium]
MPIERLHKIIAASGVTSRRKAELLISDGRVRVNGKVVDRLGSKADPERDAITVDGKRIGPRPAPLYIMLNKPEKTISMMEDPRERRTLADFLLPVKGRVFPVGRLDYDAEGMVLITNDGEFARKIMHPRSRVKKYYRVKVRGIPAAAAIKKLRRGVELEDGPTAPANVRLVQRMEKNAWLEIAIHEGRNRQVKRMCEAVGHPVMKLIRFRIGDLVMGELNPGEYRKLSPAEVRGLVNGR